MLPAVRRFQVGVGATLDAREVLERNRSSVGGFVQDGGKIRSTKSVKDNLFYDFDISSRFPILSGYTFQGVILH